MISGQVWDNIMDVSCWNIQARILEYHVTFIYILFTIVFLSFFFVEL